MVFQMVRGWVLRIDDDDDGNSLDVHIVEKPPNNSNNYTKST